jgi:hypothetical protein
MRRYLQNIAVWLSQTAHVLLFPRTGNPDLTISARAHIEAEVYGHPRWTRARDIINLMFFWQRDHCALSFAVDVRHAERVTAYRARLEA